MADVLIRQAGFTLLAFTLTTMAWTTPGWASSETLRVTEAAQRPGHGGLEEAFDLRTRAAGLEATPVEEAVAQALDQLTVDPMSADARKALSMLTALFQPRSPPQLDWRAVEGIGRTLVLHLEKVAADETWRAANQAALQALLIHGAHPIGHVSVKRKILLALVGAQRGAARLPQNIVPLDVARRAAVQDAVEALFKATLEQSNPIDHSDLWEAFDLVSPELGTLIREYGLSLLNVRIGTPTFAGLIHNDHCFVVLGCSAVQSVAGLRLALDRMMQNWLFGQRIRVLSKSALDLELETVIRQIRGDGHKVTFYGDPTQDAPLTRLMKLFEEQHVQVESPMPDAIRLDCGAFLHQLLVEGLKISAPGFVSRHINEYLAAINPGVKAAGLEAVDLAAIAGQIPAGPLAHDFFKALFDENGLKQAA